MGKTIKPVIDIECLPKEPCWYVVVTRYEQATVTDLKIGLKGNNLEDKILEWIIPIKETKKTVINKKGVEKEKISKEKLYPNYVFVKAIMNDAVWDYLRTRKGVFMILAPDGIPSIMTEEDIEKVKKMCEIK